MQSRCKNNFRSYSISERQVHVPDPAFVFQKEEKSLQNWCSQLSISVPCSLNEISWCSQHLHLNIGSLLVSEITFNPWKNELDEVLGGFASWEVFCLTCEKPILRQSHVILLLFLNPHFHKPWRKLKTQPLKLCWSLLNVSDTEDSTIKSQNIKILMALKLSYLVPINLDVNMVTMLCVHSLIMTALNWMDPQGR